MKNNTKTNDSRDIRPVDAFLIALGGIIIAIICFAIVFKSFPKQYRNMNATGTTDDQLSCIQDPTCTKNFLVPGTPDPIRRMFSRTAPQ